jgi:hypothetical protein
MGWTSPFRHRPEPLAALLDVAPATLPSISLWKLHTPKGLLERRIAANSIECRILGDLAKPPNSREPSALKPIESLPRIAARAVDFSDHVRFRRVVDWEQRAQCCLRRLLIPSGPFD